MKTCLPLSACSLLFLFAASTNAAHATPTTSPFGSLAGYNVVAIGSTTIAGTINISSDSGRLAAASKINTAAAIGPLYNDSFGNANGFDFVSPGGYSGNYVNIQSSGNAYSPSGSNQFNFNGGGHLVTTGGSPINFATVQTNMDNLSQTIANILSTGTVVSSGNALILTGVSSTLNVFTVNASALNAATDQIDINAPAGSTILINVISDQGASSNINISKLFYNGNQTNGDNAADSNILFNFNQDTNTVTFNGQFSASVLAPYATLTGNSQIDGQFIAAAFNDSGEVHNVEFTGTIPQTSPTPEPSSLLLLGTGVSAVAGALRRRRR